MNYDEAYLELKNIFSRIESDDSGLEQLNTDIAKAQELISFCKGRLREIEDKISGITENEE